MFFIPTRFEPWTCLWLTNWRSQRTSECNRSKFPSPWTTSFQHFSWILWAKDAKWTITCSRWWQSPTSSCSPEWSYNNTGRRGMKFRMPMPSTTFGGAPAPPEIIEIVSRHAEACRLAQLHFECDRLGRLIETLGSHFSWRRPGPDSQSWLTTHSKRSLTVGTAGPASKFTIFKHPLGAESALYPLVNLHNYGILWKINENHHFLGQINYVHQRVIPPEASPGRSLASSTSSTWSPSLVLQLVGQGCSRVLFKKMVKWIDWL